MEDIKKTGNKKKRIMIIGGSITIITLLGIIGFMLKDKFITPEVPIEEPISFTPPKPINKPVQNIPQPIQIKESTQFENKQTIVALPCDCEKKYYKPKTIKKVKKQKETIPSEHKYPLYF